MTMRTRSIGRFSRAAAMAAVLVAAACTSSPAGAPLDQPDWPAPDDPMARAEAAGLNPEADEFLTTHTHAHLDVFVDGERVEIPAAIGIDLNGSGIEAELMDDEVNTSYFLDSPCDTPCLSPLHTHDPFGVIHTESKVASAPSFTLGQFFTEWGVRLDASCVGEYCAPDVPIQVYLDGKPFRGDDPSEIELTSHLVIAIAIGAVPGLIPENWQWGDDP
jgi:hypothetical protein